MSQWDIMPCGICILIYCKRLAETLWLNPACCPWKMARKWQDPLEIDHVQMFLVGGFGAHSKEHFFWCACFSPKCPLLLFRTCPILISTTRKRKNENVQLADINGWKGHIHPTRLHNFRWMWPSGNQIGLAQLIAKKRNEEYYQVINYIRTRIRFSLLRSVLVAVRGERGKEAGSPAIGFCCCF